MGKLHLRFFNEMPGIASVGCSVETLNQSGFAVLKSLRIISTQSYVYVLYVNAFF